MRRVTELLFGRHVTSFVRRVLFDGLLPPLLRDFAPANWLVRRLWLGDVPMDFQQGAWSYDAKAWRSVYAATHRSLVSRSRRSDTSDAQAAWIVSRVRGLRPRTVLDVGAGAGFVARALREVMDPSSQLYLCEPYQDVAAAARRDGPRTAQLRAVAWELPFRDGAIDVLVCTHTLEHVPKLFSTFREFRRVARRILLVVPLQRWSRYSWDLHLHFFPYLEYLPGLLETPAAGARVIDGDACYEFAPGAGS